MSTRYIEPLLPDELYHHGIKGQHWGVRRYQNEDGSLTKAGLARRAADAYNDYSNEKIKILNKASQKAKPKLIKKMAIEAEYNQRFRRDTVNKIADSKSAGELANHVLGGGMDSDYMRNRSEMHSKKAENSKGIVKKFHEKEAYNTKSMSKYYKDVHDTKSIGTKIAKMTFDKYSVPMKTLSGKDTTYGKQMLKTGALAAAATIGVTAIASASMSKRRSGINLNRYFI